MTMHSRTQVRSHPLDGLSRIIHGEIHRAEQLEADHPQACLTRESLHFTMTQVHIPADDSSDGDANIWIHSTHIQINIP